MSGPKLMELRRMRAAEKRQRNRNRCACGKAEYKRLHAALEEIKKRLQGLAAPFEKSMRLPEQLNREVDESLAAEHHEQAARICDDELGIARALVEQANTLLEQRVAALHNECHQYHLAREQLLEQIAELKQQLSSAAPETAQSIREQLDKISAPGSSSPPVDAESYRSFRESDSVLRERLATMARLRTELDSFAQGRAPADLNQNLRSSIPATFHVVQPAIPARRSALAKEGSIPFAGSPPSSDELEQRLDQPSGPASTVTKIFADLERSLVKAEVECDAATALPLRERAAAVASEPDRDRRVMLAEAALLAVADQLAKTRRLKQYRTGIHQLIESAAHVQDDPEVSKLTASLRALLHLPDPLECSGLKQELAEAIAKAEARQEREEKREAIVSALAELGYEAREGMQTALVRGGRVIFQQAEETDYGVEMVVDSQLNQVQAALVRFAETQTMTEQQRRLDREKEESWCGHHARIREKLRAKGYDYSFKMQLKPGEHPVKIVAPETAAASRRAVPAQKTSKIES